jgi:hypothetical protein
MRDRPFRPTSTRPTTWSMLRAETMVNVISARTARHALISAEGAIATIHAGDEMHTYHTQAWLKLQPAIAALNVRSGVWRTNSGAVHTSQCRALGRSMLIVLLAFPYSHCQCFPRQIECLIIIPFRDEAFQTDRFRYRFPCAFLPCLHFCHSPSRQIPAALELILVRFRPSRRIPNAKLLFIQPPVPTCGNTTMGCAMRSAYDISYSARSFCSNSWAYDTRCKRKSRLDGAEMGDHDGSPGTALSR